MAPSDEPAESDSGSLLGVVGLGGALSLCCLFAAPTTAGVAGGTAASGATAALDGGLVQILVVALTATALGAALHRYT